MKKNYDNLNDPLGDDKAVDIGVNSITSVSLGPTVTYLMGVVGGDASWERVGNKIHAYDMHVRLINTWTPSTETGGITTNNLFRIALVWDYFPNSGTAPNYFEIFQERRTFGGLVSAIDSPTNRDNQERFEVLYDNLHVYRPLIGNASNTYEWKIWEKIELNKMVRFRTQGGFPSDVVNGQLMLVQRAERGVAVPLLTTEGNIRLRYIDQ